MLISFSAWLDKTPFLLLGGLLVISMTLSAACGFVFRRRRDHLHGKRGRDQAEGQEGYVVSAVLGLLALLLGFTFSLAIDRFEARRHLVLEDANAIGTAYLRVQLLQEPHRTRLSNLLVQYTDNMVNLAKVPPDRVPSLIATDDRLLTDIWAATAPASIRLRGIDFSSTLLNPSTTRSTWTPRAGRRGRHMCQQSYSSCCCSIWWFPPGYWVMCFRHRAGGGRLLS